MGTENEQHNVECRSNARFSGGPGFRIPNVTGRRFGPRAKAAVRATGGGPILRSANRPPMPARIFTIGYEDHATPPSLVMALRDAGIARLIDVRELPMSRRAGFSKTALTE